MNDKMREAIDKVFEELTAMPREEFLKEFEKHAEGDIANALMELGSITITLDNLIDVGNDGEPTGEPITITIDTVDQAKNLIDASIGGREAGERLKERFGDKSG